MFLFFGGGGGVCTYPTDLTTSHIHRSLKRLVLIRLHFCFFFAESPVDCFLLKETEL